MHNEYRKIHLKVNCVRNLQKLSVLATYENVRLHFNHKRIIGNKMNDHCYIKILHKIHTRHIHLASSCNAKMNRSSIVHNDYNGSCYCNIFQMMNLGALDNWLVAVDGLEDTSIVTDLEKTKPNKISFFILVNYKLEFLPSYIYPWKAKTGIGISTILPF